MSTISFDMKMYIYTDFVTTYEHISSEIMKLCYYVQKHPV